jgi:hypothetical protein
MSLSDTTQLKRVLRGELIDGGHCVALASIARHVPGRQGPG